MGNRAIIAFEDETSVQPFAVYLHWNGGPESVWAFLDVLTTRMADRGNDIPYASARLVEIIGRYFGGTTSLGLYGFESGDVDRLCARDDVDDIAPVDNGIYVVAWCDKLKRYAVGAHFVGGKWLSPAQITGEEAEARRHEYWQHGSDQCSIVENVTYVASYPGKKTKRWTGKGTSKGYDFDPYTFDVEKMKKEILKSRTRKPRGSSRRTSRRKAA